MQLIKYSPLLLPILLAAGCTTLNPGAMPVAQTATASIPVIEQCGTAVSSNEQTRPASIPEIDQAAAPSAGVLATELVPPVTKDIWAVLREGFRLEGTGQPQVLKAIKRYKRSPRDVEYAMQRGDPYIAYILDDVQQRGYPTEIVLLPFVESGFDPFAFSHGRAAGLWQFIPATGRLYGLKQDWWHDERRDVVASTTAALDFLGKLHRQFDGDWLLALAAYNSGSGTVSSAIRRNRKAGKPTDFWHLKLPKETRNYVPRLIAISALIRHPDQYGITLPPLAASPAFAAVDTNGQLDIGVAAELAGVETETLYRLNPGFNRWATHPDGPHRLLVPATTASVFSENLANLPAENRIKWVRHRITSGQTLSGIAQQYDTTVAVLRDANHLAGTTIRAGGHLLVPVAARDATQYAALKRAAAPRGQGSKTTYRVRNGDSLWNIAQKHSVSVRQVARWNRIGTNAVIRPGQQLVIWTKGSNGNSNERVRSIRYTVRNGDSLYLISKKFNVSIAELRRWNKLDENKYLQPGQQLTLYVDVTRPNRS
ncbi:MAG: LysM peptidoglycan-binding domain-containing protein [Gammaproteobacteria bacterium]